MSDSSALIFRLVASRINFPQGFAVKPAAARALRENGGMSPISGIGATGYY